MDFAINHITAPNLSWLDFLNLAASVGAVGVEFRNDLASPLFSDSSTEEVALALSKTGIKCLGLSQIYPFNSYSNATSLAIKHLVKTAKACGAQSISLIPRNDGTCNGARERQINLRLALREIKPILEEAKIIGLVEPLGFESSSLRTKEEALNGIEGVGGAKVFKIVHDTFHHHLAQETCFFAEHTGIVHISGVVDKTLSINEMKDPHRVMVDKKDRLGNIEQIRFLLEFGYKGPISMECFSPAIHESLFIADMLQSSFKFLKDNVF